MEKSNSWEGTHLACLLSLPLKHRRDCRNLANYLEVEFKYKPICHLVVGYSLFTSIPMSSAYFKHRTPRGAQASVF